MEVMAYLITGVYFEYFEVISVHVDQGLDFLLEAAQSDAVVQTNIPH